MYSTLCQSPPTISIQSLVMFVIIPLHFQSIWFGDIHVVHKLVNIFTEKAIQSRGRHCCYVTWLLWSDTLNHIVEHMKLYIFKEVKEQVI